MAVGCVQNHEHLNDESLPFCELLPLLPPSWQDQLTPRRGGAGGEVVPGGQDQMYCTSKNCVGRARVGPGRHDQLMPEKQIVGQGTDLVPGGMISSDHPQQTIMAGSGHTSEGWGRVRGGPRRAGSNPGRHDQLMPGKQVVGQGSELNPGGMISSDRPQQKFMKILEWSQGVGSAQNNPSKNS